PPVRFDPAVSGQPGHDEPMNRRAAIELNVECRGRYDQGSELEIKADGAPLQASAQLDLFISEAHRAIPLARGEVTRTHRNRFAWVLVQISIPMRVPQHANHPRDLRSSRGAFADVINDAEVDEEIELRGMHGKVQPLLEARLVQVCAWGSS